MLKMSESAPDQVRQQLARTSINPNGVNFQGKSLKLDTEKDCKEVIAAIADCPDLHFLNLEGNTLGVEAAKAIAKALESKKELKRALWKDMFTGRMKTEIPDALRYLGSGLKLAGTQLTELDLSDNAFGPIGVKGLAGLLSSSTCYQLQELKLNNNGLGVSGGKMLANALLECHRESTKTGKSLALKLFIAGRNRLENEGTQALSKVFKALGTLEEIAMPQNGIYHVGIKELSEALTHNKNLKVLNLNDNTLTEKGANFIAGALPHLQKLKILNLGDCLLKTGGTTIVAEALTEGHPELEELYLSYNEIRAAGGLAVAKAVKNKNKLVKLDLNGNHFGEDGRKNLSQELASAKKFSILNSLSEDEEEVESESEDSENEGDDVSEGDEDGSWESEEEEEEEVEEVADTEDTEEVEVPASQVPVTVKNVSDHDKMDGFCKALQNLNTYSPEAEPDGPLGRFLQNPSEKNFADVTKEDIEGYLLKNNETATEFYVDTFIPALMKISSLSFGNDKQNKVLTEDVSHELYLRLFDWARSKGQLSVANNTLFVHLGLIKSEDKKFKINWNVETCLSKLKSEISKGIVPDSTQQILECCLERQISNPKTV